MNSPIVSVVSKGPDPMISRLIRTACVVSFIGTILDDLCIEYDNVYCVNACVNN